jgi:hypothetical protein
MRVLHVACLVLGLSLTAGAAAAQEVVASTPNGIMTADSMATSAVAQINDAAIDAAAQKKIDLYKQLMELNGVSRSVRNSLDATKASTKTIVLERAGKATMTPADEARYNTIADGILKDTEASVIDEIARVQSQSFSADEIQQLIAANSSVAAAKYNAGKFTAPDNNADEIQTYMVEAVVKIVKTFKESISS